MRSGIEYADANRLLCELASLQVTCEECGRSNALGFRDLQSASFAGVHSYQRLCEKLRCRECPPAPQLWRRIKVAPVWRGTDTSRQTVA